MVIVVLGPERVIMHIIKRAYTHYLSVEILGISKENRILVYFPWYIHFHTIDFYFDVVRLKILHSAHIPTNTRGRMHETSLF